MEHDPSLGVGGQATPVPTLAQIAELPQFTLGDLWALAERQAAASGGPDYVAGVSDNARDVFVWHQSGGQNYARTDFKAERHRNPSDNSVDRAHYYLRHETGFVVPIAQVDPRLVSAVVDYLGAINAVDEIEGDTALRIEHSCSILDSRMEFEHHTLTHYRVYNYSAYIDEEGKGVVGLEGRHDDYDDDGIGVDEDVFSGLTPDQLAEVEFLSYDEEDAVLRDLEGMFSDSELAEQVLQSRAMYVYLMSRGAIKMGVTK